MKIGRLMDNLKSLNLPPGKYAVFGSAVMAIKGIREAPNIDVIVTDYLWGQLLKSFTPDDEGFIRSNNIKISNWWFAPTRHDISTMIKEAEIINGLPFVKLEEVRAYKSKLNRDKDKNDVKLIDQFLQSSSNLSLAFPSALGIETYRKFLNLFVKKTETVLGNKILSLILFGSVCRNEAKGNSDIDIFVFYDNSLATRNEINEALIKIILSMRNNPEYLHLAKQNIFPEIYPFLISKKGADNTLWVFLDSTKWGLILKDHDNFGKNLIASVSNKIKKSGGRWVNLGNGHWCWILFDNFSRILDNKISL